MRDGVMVGKMDLVIKFFYMYLFILLQEMYNHTLKFKKIRVTLKCNIFVYRLMRFEYLQIENDDCYSSYDSFQIPW